MVLGGSQVRVLRKFGSILVFGVAVSLSNHVEYISVFKLLSHQIQII